MKRERVLILFAIMGILTLISFYTPFQEAVRVRQALLRVVALLTAAITFLRMIDFLRFQVHDLGERNSNFLHRFTTLTVFTVVMIIGLTKGMAHPGLLSVTVSIRRAIEPTLAGIICLALIYGLFLTAKAKTSLFRSVFLMSSAFFLILFSGIFDRIHLPSPLRDALEFALSIPNGAIAGLLIGLALGGIVTTVRVLFFMDQPFSGDHS